MWGRPQTRRLRPWGFPAVSPSHPSTLPHHEIRLISVEFTDDSLFFWVPREEDPDGNGEGLARSAFPVSTFRMSSALDLFTTTLGI